MSDPFPSPTIPRASRAKVFLSYLDYFRERVVAKLASLDEDAQRTSTLPSGWTPLQLLRHLTCVERRWLEWGFAGSASDDLPGADPWADERDGRWYVPPDQSAADLIAQLHAQAARSTEIVTAHELSDIGAPGPRWDGEPPATLERVLFHLVQEYARHLGQLDVVAELAGGAVGE